MYLPHFLPVSGEKVSRDQQEPSESGALSSFQSPQCYFVLLFIAPGVFDKSGKTGSLCTLGGVDARSIGCIWTGDN